MAEQDRTGPAEESGQDEPVLNPGYRPSARHGEGAGGEQASGPEEGSVGRDEGEGARQRLNQLRGVLRSCERLLVVDEALLEMRQWPDDRQMAQARRWRDLWLLELALCAIVLAAAVAALVPPWLGGAGFGLLVAVMAWALPPVRRVFSRPPTYGQLLVRRFQLLRLARDHVRELEGHPGLVWQCAGLDGFNPALRQPRFRGLRQLSRKGQLLDFIRTQRHVRLYLMFMLEARKGYQRAQFDYLREYQRAGEKGWLGGSAPPPGP